MSLSRRWRRPLALLVLAAASLSPLRAQTDAPSATVQNSDLDAPLFYQLLIGELELASGQAGTAYQIILDAARRTRSAQLFRRAVDIALGARAGEQALAAASAWRLAEPDSVDALRLQLQILFALNRSAEAAEPLRALLAATPAAERPALIAALPRYLQRTPEPRAAARLLQEVLQDQAEQPATRVPALVAIGRGWLAAGDAPVALALARKAHELEPDAPGPALLALELMPKQAEAEAVVKSHLARPGAEAAIRLGYVRPLMEAQRYAEAIEQLEQVTRAQPDSAGPFLTLGALHVELRQPAPAQQALQRFLQLRAAARQGGSDKADAEAHGAAAPAGESTDADGNAEAQAEIQARLLLAQAAEMRGDLEAAEAWLAGIDDPKSLLDVQTRRATLMARRGQVDQARELLRRTPERSPTDARAKLVAEAGVLREVRRWPEAFEVFQQAAERFPDDADLLYEQAMVAEKLDRLDELERLLRRVIALKPDNAHAHNALGYSLADRRQRLPEARRLIERALELAPGDPFITDSLGWVEFRMGNREEALRLLRRAWAARPDTEIGAHLGEVLWVSGLREEARKVWREARQRDAGNEVLRETLVRLKADL